MAPERRRAGRPRVGVPATRAPAPLDPARDPATALVTAAREVRRRAHAPYSRFRVGAAVRDETGRIHVGCNVENASYGLTTCAERNAVVAAIAAGARAIRAVAVVTGTRPPGAPCGACRQVLAEFADDDAPVWLASPTGAPSQRRLGDLLPDTFRFRPALRPRRG